jgi:hypothetical protein
MAWYDDIANTTKGNVQGLINALRNPVDTAKAQFDKGAPYREALASAIRGDMSGVNQALSQSDLTPMDAAMMLGTIKGVGGKMPKTQFEMAHDLAQERAALPVSEGGLGLPANNTAMDRAKAMGFDTKNIEYHTTDVKRIPSIYEHGFMNVSRGERNLKHLGSEYGDDRYYATGQGNYTSDNPLASWFTAQGKTGANQAMLPLMINKSKHFDYTNPNHIEDLMTPKENYVETLGKAEMSPKDLKALQEGKHYLMEDWITLMNLKKRGYTGTNLIEPKQYYGGEGVTTNTFNPSDIRSINAAFDPFRRNENDILAGVGALPFIDYKKDKK